MQKDVKLGLVIGVLFLALIVVLYIHRERAIMPPGVAEFTPMDIETIRRGFGDEVDAGREAAVPGSDATVPDEGETAVPPQESETQTYVVRKNDSLWKIAQRFYGDGTKLSIILEANRAAIKNPDRLTVGQTLVIPPLPDKKPLVLAVQESVQRTHTVQKGDNLYRIAERYYGNSSKWRKILAANPTLKSEKDLRVGMVLIIPEE